MCINVKLQTPTGGSRAQSTDSAAWLPASCSNTAEISYMLAVCVLLAVAMCLAGLGVQSGFGPLPCHLQLQVITVEGVGRSAAVQSVWLTAHPVLLRIQTLNQQVLCMLLRKLSIVEKVLGGKVEQLCQTVSTASSLSCSKIQWICWWNPCSHNMPIKQHGLVHT